MWAMPPPMMRRGNRRASRQNHTRHENRECLDDLVHVTPATFFFDFPQEPFPRLQRVRKPTSENLTTKLFHRTMRVPIIRPLPSR